MQPVESTELTTIPESISAIAMETVLIGGDLSELPPAERVRYYQGVCRSIGLNPLTKPFEYIKLNGKVTLYAKRDCTDQLRRIQNVSIRIVSRELIEDTYVVTVRATSGNREDEAIGAVSLGSLKGEMRANALMKAETKAKRRVTLSICGLGWLDESETYSVAGAARMVVDDSGEIIGQDGGTREQQDEVLKRKMAELSAPEAGILIDESGPKKDAHALPFNVLDNFRAIKRTIGEEAYYRILKVHGYEKSNQIPDTKTARTIYKEMAEELKAIRATEEAEKEKQ